MLHSAVGAIRDLKNGHAKWRALRIAHAAAASGVPMAWLADRFDRRWVLAACVLFWSMATAVRGLGHDFTTKSCSPSARSRCARRWAYPTRSWASSKGLGLILAGAVFKAMDVHAAELPSFPRGLESWRTATFAVAVVGPVFAALVLSIQDKQTPRRKVERADQGRATGELARFLRLHWRAMAGIFGSAAAGAAALSPLMAWLPVAVARQFGLTPAEVGAQTGGLFLAATVSGIAISVVINRLWGRRLGDMVNVLASPYLTALSAVPLAFVAFSQTACGVYVAIFLVLMMLIAFNAVAILAGALGPIAVGFLSDRMAPNSNGLLTDADEAPQGGAIRRGRSSDLARARVLCPRLGCASRSVCR